MFVISSLQGQQPRVESTKRKKKVPQAPTAPHLRGANPNLHLSLPGKGRRFDREKSKGEKKGGAFRRVSSRKVQDEGMGEELDEELDLEGIPDEHAAGTPPPFWGEAPQRTTTAFPDIVTQPPALFPCKSLPALLDICPPPPEEMGKENEPLFDEEVAFPERAHSMGELRTFNIRLLPDSGMASASGWLGADGRTSKERTSPLRVTSEEQSGGDSNTKNQSAVERGQRRRSWIAITSEDGDVAVAPPQPRARRASAQSVGSGGDSKVSGSSVSLSASEEWKWERTRVYEWGYMTYMCLEQPQSSFIATVVSIGLVAVIILSIIIFVLETERSIYETFPPSAWWYTELAFTLIFTTEVVTRLLAHIIVRLPCAFFTDAMNWLDVLSILPFYVEVAFSMRSGGDSPPGLESLRAIRLVRVFRLIKLKRYSKALQLVADGLKNSAMPLQLLAFTCLLGLPSVPLTGLGKFLGTLVIFAGVAIVSVPVGMVTIKFGDTYNAANYSGDRDKSPLASSDIDLSPKIDVRRRSMLAKALADGRESISPPFTARRSSVPSLAALLPPEDLKAFPLWAVIFRLLHRQNEQKRQGVPDGKDDTEAIQPLLGRTLVQLTYLPIAPLHGGRHSIDSIFSPPRGRGSVYSSVVTVQITETERDGRAVRRALQAFDLTEGEGAGLALVREAAAAAMLTKAVKWNENHQADPSPSPPLSARQRTSRGCLSDSNSKKDLNSPPSPMPSSPPSSPGPPEKLALEPPQKPADVSSAQVKKASTLDDLAADGCFSASTLERACDEVAREAAEESLISALLSSRAFDEESELCPEEQHKMRRSISAARQQVAAQKEKKLRELQNLRRLLRQEQRLRLLLVDRMRRLTGSFSDPGDSENESGSEREKDNLERAEQLDEVVVTIPSPETAQKEVLVGPHALV
uniref:Ion transport domain-containing protein n=2 Tax=Chromera velia CCMP2878 TaxID=1169474 RepID=A0A0G4HXR4_9ALVE|eukprot:Cvel_9323.t1-p1 / transcript=Cvel_9323.t1 / gene=Cvel_9323 / organism=Chromera_velia_CCMP2878 / gene_product=Potassium voltage-gated channel subfamily A member, putative / transcript_product=Potassium voltage-gated channel subfamily A member, putative / location=Cvel_scaffold534:73684-81036(+) / protein_length=919 / sequence_SO=supercontig / SO=protein_coding / is_pseudo=false